MRMKDFLLGIEDDLRSKGNYCCYCLEPQGDKFSCCGENHFETYAEMRHEDQMAILDEMVADELEILAKEKK